MAIKNSEALSMAEALKIVEQTKKEDTEVVGFIKKFCKIKAEEAEDIKKKLRELDIIKIKEEHIVKIIDLISEPELLDLNKVFTDVSLDEDEKKKIQEVIDKYI